LQIPICYPKGFLSSSSRSFLAL